MVDGASQFEPETRAIRRLQTAMAEAEAMLGQRLRMNPTDLAALAHLAWATGPVGPGDLAQFLNISAAAATDVVDRLTAAGHVERRRDLADRRRVRLQVSDLATTTMSRHIGPLVQSIDAAAREWTDPEREVILRFLARVTHAYTAWTDGGGAQGSARA